MIAALGLNATDRHLAALPLFHITGLGLSMAVFQVGGANLVMETFDPAQAALLMDEHQVTLMADFPPILTMLLDAKETSGAHWDTLRYVLGLDAPDVIQRLYSETEAKFWTGFGQSEIAGVATLGTKQGRMYPVVIRARLLSADRPCLLVTGGIQMRRTTLFVRSGIIRATLADSMRMGTSITWVECLKKT